MQLLRRLFHRVCKEKSSLKERMDLRGGDEDKRIERKGKEIGDKAQNWDEERGTHPLNSNCRRKFSLFWYCQRLL